MERVLDKKVSITGSIFVLTGLHIGGSNAAMTIGGNDNPVLRDPLTDKPFIPGSSIKGKIRSLLEVDNSSYTSNGSPSSDPESTEAQLFGMAGKKQKIPSRAIFRDCFINLPEEQQNKLESFTELPYTELKYENQINRITSEANPRPLERVPAGTSFDFNVLINIYQGDDIDLYVKNMLKGLTFLCDDYLGGSGSRGSGKVAFQINGIKGRTSAYYEGKANEENMETNYEAEINRLHQYLPQQNQ